MSFRPWALWLLGYSEAAFEDTSHALRDAREIGQTGTLMYALAFASCALVFCGNYATAMMQFDELAAPAEEKGALLWKVGGMVFQGCLFALTGKAADAVQTLTSAIAAYRSTGATVWRPWS